MILLPSILAADFARLADDVARAEKGGAGAVHADVMDGHFVPNLTIGPPVVKALRRATTLPIDVHLMIEEPDRFIDAFVEAGASWISVHVEATPHLQRTVAHVRSRGVRPGVVLNPATPLATLEEVLPDLDLLLVMSVNPGFAGQRFMAEVLPKVCEKVSCVGESATTGAVSPPSPVRAAVLAPPGPLWATLRLPERVPASVGRKLSATVQLAPAASDCPLAQVPPAWEKSLPAVRLMSPSTSAAVTVVPPPGASR